MLSFSFQSFIVNIAIKTGNKLADFITKEPSFRLKYNVHFTVTLNREKCIVLLQDPFARQSQARRIHFLFSFLTKLTIKVTT